MNNLHLKFPLKNKVFQKLKAKSLDLFNKTHFLKRENTNEIKKLQKLKKILVFVLKLKQVLLNPKLYNKI